ncbi:MAG: LCP family protein [Acidimicrobiales bacterium]
MAAVSRGQPPPRRTWAQRMIIGMGTCLVLCGLISAVGVAYVGAKLGQVDTYDIELPDAASGAPRNYLVVGSDSRAVVAASDPNADVLLGGESGGRRADTILVVRVDPSKETAVMLSLPRDLWVPVAGRDEHQRINAAYGMGKQVLVDTVQQYLGVPVHHYIEVDFRGFQSLVQAIDGVPLYFDRAMRDARSGFDVLHPGCVTLDGSAALAFARARELEYILDGEWRTDPTGDLGRISRQQLFIRRAISRAGSRGLSNPITLKRLVDLGVANVGIDKGLSVRDMLGLGRRFKGFGGEELNTLSLPVTSFTTDGGADVLQLDEEASVATLDLFRNEPGAVPGGSGGESDDPAEAEVSVRVLNGASVPKRAANVAGALQASGFTIAGLGDVEDIGGSDIDGIEIHHGLGDGAAADLVARHLTDGARVVADDDMEAGTVVLVAGRGRLTVRAAALARARTPVGSVDDERETNRSGAASSTTAPATSRPTTTVPVGRTPGEAPPGIECG